jgi:hypothetical protein
MERARRNVGDEVFVEAATLGGASQRLHYGGATIGDGEGNTRLLAGPVDAHRRIPHAVHTRRHARFMVLVSELGDYIMASKPWITVSGFLLSRHGRISDCSMRRYALHTNGDTTIEPVPTQLAAKKMGSGVRTGGNVGRAVRLCGT